MYVYEFITGVIKIFFTKFGDHVIAMFCLLHHFRTWATTLLQYLQVLRIQVNLVQNFYHVMAQVKKKN